MSVKVADLNIVERDWPLIVKSYSSDTVHISRANGEEDGKHSYIVTVCNRALEHPAHINTIYDDSKYCSRCGSLVDFKAVLAESKRKMAERSREDAKRREAELEAYRNRVRDEGRQLEEFAAFLAADGYAIEHSEHSFIVTYDGNRFEVRNA